MSCGQCLKLHAEVERLKAELEHLTTEYLSLEFRLAEVEGELTMIGVRLSLNTETLERVQAELADAVAELALLKSA